MRFFYFFVFLAISISLGSCQRPRLEIKKAKVGDVELAYYTRGSGDPLLMIMGFRGTMAAWDPALLNALEKHFTLILFDSRGVGFSTDTPENLTTIDQMAADAATLIKTLGFQNAHVLGWSMGSRVGMEMALNHPEVVRSLILCAPNPGGTFQAERKSNAYQKLTSTTISPTEVLSLIFPNNNEGKKAEAAFIYRLTHEMTLGTIPTDMTVSNQTTERQIHALHLWSQSNTPYERLKTLKVPTLVTGGMEDALDPVENVQRVANRIPFAWAAYFPGAGHYFLSQDHERFAELVNLFIDSTKNINYK